jgi:hypothetical protein
MQVPSEARSYGEVACRVMDEEAARNFASEFRAAGRRIAREIDDWPSATGQRTQVANTLTAAAIFGAVLSAATPAVDPTTCD